MGPICHCPQKYNLFLSQRDQPQRIDKSISINVAINGGKRTIKLAVLYLYSQQQDSSSEMAHANSVCIKDNKITTFQKTNDNPENCNPTNKVNEIYQPGKHDPTILLSYSTMRKEQVMNHLTCT